MRSIFKPSLAALALIVTLGACTKKAADKTTSSGTFTSTGAGPISSSGTTVTAAGATGAKLEIMARSSSGAQYDIHISPYNGTTGTIVMDQYLNGVTYVASATSDIVIPSAHGTITLTATSPDIVGSFDYVGVDSAVYTGSFSVTAP